MPGVAGAHHAKLLTVIGDDTDLFVADLFVQLQFLLRANGKTPPSNWVLVCKKKEHGSGCHALLSTHKTPAGIPVTRAFLF
jgi:hypothetical protein